MENLRSKLWTQEELDRLTNVWSKATSKEEILRVMEPRSWESVKHKASKLGLPSLISRGIATRQKPVFLWCNLKFATPFKGASGQKLYYCARTDSVVGEMPRMCTHCSEAKKEAMELPIKSDFEDKPIWRGHSWLSRGRQ